MSDDSLQWLNDEINSECNQSMLQRAQHIVRHERDAMLGLQCLDSSDDDGTRLTLTARMRGITSPGSTYTVQATIDLADELFLARYCSCPAFGKADSATHRWGSRYRGFSDDDYDDEYAVFDDFDDGPVFGHIPDDDEYAMTSASGSDSSRSSARYTGICKHVAALLLLFLSEPESFHGYRGMYGQTPRQLASYMRMLDERRSESNGRLRSDLHNRLCEAKDRLALEQGGGQAVRGTSRGETRLSKDLDLVMPASVRLEPVLVLGEQAWSLQLRIVHGSGASCVSYVVKNIARMVADVRSGAYSSYGRRLSFRHAPEMFDLFSRELIDFLERAMVSRRISQMHNKYAAGTLTVDKELFLADWEVCDLLDLYRTLPGAIGLRMDGMPVAADRNIPVLEGMPGIDFGAQYTHRMASGGVRITSGCTVLATLAGQRSQYILADACGGYSHPAFYRCDEAVRPALHVLESLCTGESDGVFIHEDDWPMFARTILPTLASCGFSLDVPQEVGSGVPAECELAFYLDRDLDGITCEIVARYGRIAFQLVPAATALHGMVHADSSKAASIERDTQRERLGVETVRQLFPEWDDNMPARIGEQDDNAILLLLTDGVAMLGSIGQVFSTAAFDGLMRESSPTVKVGLSIDSNLVEISPIASEVPMNEVGSVLNSYRRRRRYHRLRDGSFVDLQHADLAELDAVASDLDLNEEQLNAGRIEVPGYQAFLLDSQLPDETKSASFNRYVSDVKVIDPQRYAVPEALHGILRPYQVEGFQWLATLCDKGFGGILADEMGLGKSLQLLTLLESRKGKGCSLIVCPASLVYNWAAECEKFTPDQRVEVVAGSKAERRRLLSEVAGLASAKNEGRKERPDIIITSYDLLRRDIDEYDGCAFDCVALDEAQYIKNHTTKIAKAVKRLEAHHRFALTGTPIENRLSELWSIFDFLMPGMLGSYARFRERYEQPILAPGPDQSVMAGKLQALVGLFIKRRLKRDVLTDLPDKFETVVTVRLQGEQRKLYAAHEQRLRASLNSVEDADFDTNRIRILAELTLLREICCAPKLVYEDANGASAKLDAIDDLVASCMDAGKKVLVFSQFTSFLDLIGDRFTAHGVPFYTITGETPKRKRVDLVNQFNMDDVPVFLISLKAGNTGLNLTGASVVIHADPWWNAAAQSQATDRAHRIGQTQDVNVYQIVAQHTIEERILRLQKEKSALARQFTDGAANGSIGSLTKDDLLGLLQ